MEEILELKELIQKHDYEGALKLVEELEDMSKKDIINNIQSYAIILLLHLIKQAVENRTTHSWDVSITNSILQIQFLNRRRKGRGNYLDQEDLEEAVLSAWQPAINKASLEILEGLLSSKEVAARVNKDTLIQQALDAIRF